MTDCIFCKILAGEIPATKVYEDDTVLAFLDIHPNAKGHTLVVPKTHARNVLHMSENALCDLMRPVQKIATAVMKGVGAHGVNIAINNEEAAGQIVFHTHVHIIPRINGSSYRSHTSYEDGEAEEVAGRIREVLDIRH